MFNEYIEHVAAFTGPRGASKTANAVLWCIDGMIAGMPCHSLVKIAARVLLPEGGSKNIESIDLDYPKFITNPSTFFRVIAFLDELQLFANSLRSTSNGNLLLHEISTQIRKQEMTLYFCCQDFDWADSRFTFQTDVLVECSDMKFTPWGMEEGLQRGELCQTVYKDLTGIYTGRPYHKYYEEHVFVVPVKEVIWGAYDHKKMVDPNLGRKQYSFEKEQIVIKQGEQGQYMETKQNAGDVELRVRSMMGELGRYGETSIGTKDLWARLEDMGIDYDHGRIGRVLNQMGLEKRYTRKGGIYKEYYVFPNHPEHSLSRQAEKERELAGAKK